MRYLADVKKDYAGVFAAHQIGTAKDDLSARMVDDCSMHTTCYAGVHEIFREFRPAYQ